MHATTDAATEVDADADSYAEAVVVWSGFSLPWSLCLRELGMCDDDVCHQEVSQKMVL